MHVDPHTSNGSGHVQLCPKGVFLDFLPFNWLTREIEGFASTNFSSECSLPVQHLPVYISSRPLYLFIEYCI